jgi:hypothetical protein
VLASLNFSPDHDDARNPSRLIAPARELVEALLALRGLRKGPGKGLEEGPEEGPEEGIKPRVEDRSNPGWRTGFAVVGASAADRAVYARALTAIMEAADPEEDRREDWILNSERGAQTAHGSGPRW